MQVKLDPITSRYIGDLRADNRPPSNALRRNGGVVDPKDVDAIQKAAERRTSRLTRKAGTIA